jgi:prepilin-type N-terminal cleavage/methylation domain-containing protein
MHPGRTRAGFTLLEVVISSAILSVSLLAATAAFSSNRLAVNQAKRLTTGTIFLETVMEDVTAQDYDNLLALNGNRILDGPALARSEFAVDLTVFNTAVDLIQVTAALTDLDSGRELGRVATMRRRE